MAKRTSVQKAHRLVTLLLALRFATIAQVLEARGMTPARRAEGWRLLEAMADSSIRLGSEPSRDDTAQILRALDAWENQYFAIAGATLRRHYPKLAALVFTDLQRGSGAAVVPAVSTFLTRIDSLGDHDDGAAAAALLAERGLHEDELAVARGLLSRLESLAPTPPNDHAAAREAFERAETAMWAYYLEWSGIARACITSKRDLKRLGFAFDTRGEPSG